MYEKQVAVIGTGFIGPVHVEAVRRLGITVKGVLGSSPEKSNAAAKAMNLEVGYASLDDILDDKDIGAVHVASPNKFHFDQVRRSMEAGKHVMCEKPLTTNSRESAELTALAEKYDVVTGVNYNIRYYPLNLEARNRISSAGDIHEISGGYVQDWLLYKDDFNWRVLSDMGGPLRVVGDIGTHWLDLVTFVTGKTVASVMADLYMIHPVRSRPAGPAETFSSDAKNAAEEVEVDTEDGGNILLRFTDGSRGSLRVSQVAAGRKNRLYYELCGAGESLAWDQENPNTLWVGRRGEMNGELIKNPALQSDAANAFTGYPGGHAEGFPDSHKQCFRAFYNAVTGRKSPVSHPSFFEGHKEMLLCEAILKSSDSNSWVDIDYE